MLVLGVLCGAALLTQAADMAMNNSASANLNPYAPIVARNIFGLLPIPTNPPVDPNAALATPPPKITPNGTMTLFGVPQALFKVAWPPAGGQPAKEQSYVLAEGESQDNIEVTKIDQAAGVITFNNNGTVQVLPLAAAPKLTTPASPIIGPSGAIGGGPAQGGGIPRPMLGRPGFPRSQANPANPASPGDQAQGDNGGVPSVAAGEGNIVNGIYNPGAQAQELSPEANAVLIEQAYLAAKAKNDGTAPLFPTTPLRGQSDASFNGDAGAGGGTAPNP